MAHIIEDSGTLRTFESGATRDTGEGKHEPWGFTSALVEKRFCEYMHKHRQQSDGELRASDNWKNGIPLSSYRHSLSRHVQDLRLILDGYPQEAREQDPEEALCAILFNVQGMLHEILKSACGNPPGEDAEPSPSCPPSPARPPAAPPARSPAGRL